MLTLLYCLKSVRSHDSAPKLQEKLETMSITLPDIPISLTETTTNNPTPTLTEQETVQKMITEMMSAQGPIPQFSDFATTPNANPWQNEETSEESEEHDEATSTTEPITQ